MVHPKELFVFVLIQRRLEPFLHLLPQFLRFQDLEVGSSRREGIEEVIGRPDVEGEVGIVIRGLDLLLGRMEGESPHIVRCLAVGADTDVLQRNLIVGQHTIELAEIGFRRETIRQFERLVQNLDGSHPVERICDEVLSVGREQIPALVPQLQRIRSHVDVVSAVAEPGVADLDLVAGLDGLDKRLQVLSQLSYTPI